MVEDIFSEVKANVSEFTDVYYVDYERESLLLSVHADYLDEIFKIIRQDFLCMEIVFVKELDGGIFTIIAQIPPLTGIFNETGEYDED